MNTNLTLIQAVCILILITLPRITFSQRSSVYEASNGITYSVGDSIVLGVGSSPDGFFNHIYSSLARTIFGSLAAEYDQDLRLPEYFHGAPIVIKKIRIRESEALFNFDTDGWGVFVIDVEKAIAACEISYCRPHGFLKQQEFEKLILLFRAFQQGDISSEKFWMLRNEMIGID